MATHLVVPLKSLMVIATSLLSLGGLYYFVNGRAWHGDLRGRDRTGNRLADGDSGYRVIALTFFVGGAMGGLAGFLFGLHYSLVDPYSGFAPGLKAFTAAVLGGIGNIPGAMLGGMVLGLLEGFAASYLSILTDGAFGAEYPDVFAFLVLIMIFIFVPEGCLVRPCARAGVSGSLPSLGSLAYSLPAPCWPLFSPSAPLSPGQASLLLLCYVGAA